MFPYIILHMNIGGFNRLSYDSCAYDQQLHDSTSPFDYQMYGGKFENCDKCIVDKFYLKQDPALVDVESELRNITRPYSKCNNLKYSPNCKKSGMCTSTFDKSVPIVPVPEVCPIVFNNIPRQTSPGYTVPSRNICRK